MFETLSPVRPILRCCMVWPPPDRRTSRSDRSDARTLQLRSETRTGVRFPPREHIKHGGSLPSQAREEITVARDRLLTIRGVTHQDLVRPCQVVMRHQAKDVESEVIVLAVGEYGPVEDGVAVEVPRVAEFTVRRGITVVGDLAKLHEERVE